MTEAEWLVATDPRRMLSQLTKLSRRESLLAAVALSRRFWPHPFGSELGKQIELAERYADGSATADEVFQEWNLIVETSDRFMGDSTAAMIGVLDLALPPIAPIECVLEFAKRELGSWEASILRCVFGNPFRAVSADPSWLTSTVTALAEGIYQDRAFDRLPILADALQDADCDNSDILTHCRSSGPHVRGCWAVDLLTGRK